MPKYFALVSAENVVENVIAAEQEFIDANPPEEGKQWVETFINGEGGKKYAGIGGLYDQSIEDFLSPRPFPSWVQNGNQWEAPTAKPSEGQWLWDEDTLAWVEWIPS